MQAFDGGSESRSAEPLSTPTCGSRLREYKVVSIVVCVLLCVAAALIGQLVPPFCRPFRFDDPTIGYAYAKPETFPSYSLIVMELASAAVVAVIHLALTRNVHSTVMWMVVFVYAFTFQFVPQTTMKVYAGRLRPDFIDRLAIAGFNASSRVDYCALTREFSIIRDGRLSFPSGHSSTSFSALLPLAFYLMSLLEPFRHQSAARYAVCITPLVLAVIVCVSRTRDNRHHYADILTGALLGIQGSFVAVRLVFPIPPGRHVPLLCVAPDTLVRETQLDGGPLRSHA